MSGFEAPIAGVAVGVLNSAVKTATGKSIANNCRSALKGLRNIVLQKAGKKATKEAEELLFNKKKRAEFGNRLDSLENLLASVASNPAAEDESVKQELVGLQEFLEGATANDADERAGVLKTITERMTSLNTALLLTANKQSETEKRREYKDTQIKKHEIKLGSVEAEPFARGGSSLVHKAKYQGDTVVLKKIDQRGITAAKRKNKLKSFKRELAIMVQLLSPRVVTVLGVVTTDETFLGLVTEYCAGGALRHRLDDEDAVITSGQRWTWVSDVAVGMAYLHSQGVEHRDLKALNVLLTGDDRGKVSDFGLSKCEELKTAATSTLGQAGTPAFMAPEFLDENVFSEASDVYSFAIVMWEIWSRQVPWSDTNPMQIMRNVVDNGERPPVPAAMPPELRKLMVRAWAHDAGERPTFEELAAKLKVSNIDLSELVKLGSLEANLTLSAVLILDAMEEIENSSRANHSRGVGTFWGWVE